MPYKPVGADENGKFPPRVEAALDTTYGSPVVKLAAFGDVDTTGAADASAVMLAAIAEAQAVGGTVELPKGTIRIDQKIVFGFQSGGVQKSVRITGQGRATNWEVGGGEGGTVLDLRYSGAGHKIETYGQGVLELDHLTLADNGTSSTPFLLTIGTTLHAHDMAVIGNPSKSRETCDQDVFVLGGLAGTTTNDGPTHAFQGYGSVIERVLFEKIRSGVVLRRFANSVVISANSWSNRCGANNDQGAIEFSPGTGAAVPGGEPEAFISACVTRDNLIEVYGYKYGIRCMNKTYLNMFSGNAFWDVHRADYAADMFFDTNAGNNTVIGTTIQTQGKHWTDLNGSNVYYGIWDEPGVGPLPTIRANNTGLHIKGGGGLRLQNNAALYVKDTGGADRSLLTLSSGNILYLGDTAAAMSNQSVIVRCGATGSIIRLRAGSADQFQVSAVGLGFFGTGPNAKAAITGAKGSPGAIASLMTSLANYGLITDSTTAGLSTKTANHTITTADHYVVSNGTSLTMTLPDPTSLPAGLQPFIVKNINASAVTVATGGASKTIDGAATQSLAQWASARYVSDGTQWLTVA